MPTLIAARNKVGALSRFRPPDHPELIDAHRSLTETVLESHIRHALATRCGLTDEQRARLAEMLQTSQAATD